MKLRETKWKQIAKAQSEKHVFYEQAKKTHIELFAKNPMKNTRRKSIAQGENNICKRYMLRIKLFGQRADSAFRRLVPIFMREILFVKRDSTYIIHERKLIQQINIQ